MPERTNLPDVLMQTSSNSYWAVFNLQCFHLFATLHAQDSATPANLNFTMTVNLTFGYVGEKGSLYCIGHENLFLDQYEKNNQWPIDFECTIPWLL